MYIYIVFVLLCLYTNMYIKITAIMFIKLPVCVSADISFHRFKLLFGEFKGDKHNVCML